MRAVGAGQAEDIKEITPGQRVCIERRARRHLAERVDADERFARVRIGQRFGDRFGRRAVLGREERNHRQHPAVIIAEHRHKQRRGGKAADGLHLGQVLVVQRQRIRPAAGQPCGTVGGFVIGNHE